MQVYLGFLAIFVAIDLLLISLSYTDIPFLKINNKLLTRSSWMQTCKKYISQWTWTPYRHIATRPSLSTITKVIEKIVEVNTNKYIKDIDICDFSQDTSPTPAPLKKLSVTSTILTTLLEVHSYTHLHSLFPSYSPEHYRTYWAPLHKTPREMNIRITFWRPCI